MEFPEVGRHCDHPNCRQLEFLPLRCKCNKVFCSDHFKSHVEICELTISNVVSDLKEIRDSYECSFDGCKTTSIVPLICEKCQKHYCIKHRHINECEPVDPKLLAEAKKKVLAPIQQYNEAKATIDQEVFKYLIYDVNKNISRFFLQLS